MKDQEKTLEDLIAGGLIGAALGAWLSKDKEDGAITGALIGAAISATRRANKEALKTDQPVLIAENGKLYRLFPNGKKQFIRNLAKTSGHAGTHNKHK